MAEPLTKFAWLHANELISWRFGTHSPSIVCEQLERSLLGNDGIFVADRNIVRAVSDAFPRS
jgi:hypothetical protein